MLVTRAPMSTRASISTAARRLAPERAQHRERGEVDHRLAVRPAFWTASTLARTISRAAATSRPARVRTPLESVSSSTGWKSRTAWSTGIGSEVLHLEGQARGELVAGEPWQVHLAHDHPLVRDPEHDLLVAQLRWPPTAADRLRRRRSAVDDLAVVDGARGQHDLPETLERDPAAPEGQFGGADDGRPDVETDGRATRHVPVLLSARTDVKVRHADRVQWAAT